MFGNLFKNPKAALAYVGITLCSVVLFVGTEDDPGTLQNTIDTLDSGKGLSEGDGESRFGASANEEAVTLGQTSRRTDSEAATEFVPDEELIDDVSGFAPKPLGSISGFDPNPDSSPFLSDQDAIAAQDNGGGWAVGLDD